LSSCILRLLTGYAVTFNRRHHRCVHLFQNRFRSTLVDQGSYLLELVRYIHLNAMAAGMVALDDLDPWTGHSVECSATERTTVRRPTSPLPALDGKKG
jgi:REP-associated tyrosine transposase